MAGRNYAFSTKKIETDRPDQTETPFLTPRGWAQIEAGFNKENVTDQAYILVHPTALLKYGVSKKFELRLEANEVTDYTPLIPQPKTTSGLLPVEVGGKLFLAGERGLRPKTSLIAHVGLPFFSSRAFHTPHLAPSFRFVMQTTLTQTIGLGYNVGAEWDGTSTTPSWLYTIAPGFNIGNRWYAYVEAFGYIIKNAKPQHNLDAGVAFFVSDNTKLDVSGGLGLSPDTFKNYMAIGFSFRLPVAKKSAVQ